MYCINQSIAIFVLSITKTDTMKTIVIGNIGSKEQAEKIQKLLTGKTYMSFIVDYSVSCGNYPVSISTERENTSNEELMQMALFYISANL